MKLLIDAQLPLRLAWQLEAAGHDVVHTSALPNGNRSADSDISRIADEQNRIVVTKDRDFRDGHLLRNTPQRLLLVETGNVSNNDLLALFDKNANDIVAALDDSPFVELAFDRLVLHEPRSS